MPEADNLFDSVITFGTPLPFVDWATGELTKSGALLRVQTRPSILYGRLFAALGDFATGVEYMLLFVAIVFALIELLALLVGTRLTRTVTGAVAQLYDATDSHQSRRLQSPHFSQVERPACHSGQFVQFHDRLDRKSDRGAKRKAAAAE